MFGDRCLPKSLVLLFFYAMMIRYVTHAFYRNPHSGKLEEKKRWRRRQLYGQTNMRTAAGLKLNEIFNPVSVPFQSQQYHNNNQPTHFFGPTNGVGYFTVLQVIVSITVHIYAESYTPEQYKTKIKNKAQSKESCVYLFDRKRNISVILSTYLSTSSSSWKWIHTPHHLFRRDHRYPRPRPQILLILLLLLSLQHLPLLDCIMILSSTATATTTATMNNI